MLTFLHLCILTTVIVLFNCVGLFGNINVLVAVFRAPTLRTKAGYLMALLCMFQSVCLISELVNLRIYWRLFTTHIFYQILFFILLPPVWLRHFLQYHCHHRSCLAVGESVMEQSNCFRLLSVYLFANIAQSLMYLMIVLDMMIAVALPLKHKVWSTSLYAGFMCIPPALIAATALTASHFLMGNVEVKVCRPPTVAHGVITAIATLLMVSNTAAIAVVLVLLGIVIRSERMLRGSRHRRNVGSNEPFVTNKSVRTVSGLVAVFVSTWYFSVASILIALHLGLSEENLDHIMTLIMIPTLIAYSQNFYGLHACPRYAPILRQQMAWLMTGTSNADGIPSGRASTLRSSSSRIATTTGIPAATTTQKCSSPGIATITT